MHRCDVVLVNTILAKNHNLLVAYRRVYELVAHRELEPLPEPLNPHEAMFLDNRLVFTTDSATIVITGSPVEANHK